jgi:hypothetical protein
MAFPRPAVASAVKQGWIDLQVPFAIHYLAAFGPMLAALVVTAATSGEAGLKELWGRMTKWQVGWKWSSFCILSPAVVFALSIPIVRLIKGEWPDLRLLGQANYLPYLGPGVILIWVVTYGFGEETGVVSPRRACSEDERSWRHRSAGGGGVASASLSFRDPAGNGFIFLPGFLRGAVRGDLHLDVQRHRGSVLMVVLYGFFDFYGLESRVISSRS